MQGLRYKSGWLSGLATLPLTQEHKTHTHKDRAGKLAVPVAGDSHITIFGLRTRRI